MDEHEKPLKTAITDYLRNFPGHPMMSELIITTCECGIKDCEKFAIIARNPIPKSVEGTTETVFLVKVPKAAIPEMIQNLRNML